MTAPRIVSCLWFDQNAADGVRLYTEALPDARAVATSHYPDAHDNPDRFGVSWQIVPVDMPRWMTGGDRAARDGAFQAMLTMKKLDIAAMEGAFRGASPDAGGRR